MSEKRVRVFYLDFLRFISIFLIIMFHFNQQLGFHLINSEGVFIQNFKNDNIGSIGITLFIILSGASLMLNYKDSFSWKNYFFKRFLSIYPIFWVGYLITFLVLFTINTGIHQNVEYWKILLTLVGIDGFLYYKIPNFYLVGEWFLGFIIIMYIIFPFLRIAVIKKPIITVIVVLSLYFLVVSNYNNLFEINVIHNPITRLPELLFGMIFILYFDKIRSKLFLPALVISLILFLFKVDIPHIYVTFIIGSTLFIIFAQFSNLFTIEWIRKSIGFISKFSFAAFIIHHNLIGQFLVRFDTKTLSSVETYVLFLIVTILIFWLAVHLSKISDRISIFLKTFYNKYSKSS